MPALVNDPPVNSRSTPSSRLTSPLLSIVVPLSNRVVAPTSISRLLVTGTRRWRWPPPGIRARKPLLMSGEPVSTAERSAAEDARRSTPALTTAAPASVAVESPSAVAWTVTSWLTGMVPRRMLGSPPGSSTNEPPPELSSSVDPSLSTTGLDERAPPAWRNVPWTTVKAPPFVTLDPGFEAKVAR